MRAVPGVAAAAGDITDLETKILGKDGKVVGDGPWFGIGLDPRRGPRRASSRPSA